ncbi:MAG: tetratricopeptide repeat protein [Thermodesulfobacteriota bacterium]
MDNDTLNRGIRLAKEGYFREALKVFDKNICFTQNPTAMSYYAISMAFEEGDYDRAVSFCLMAAEKEFYNPEIYLNLGRVFLISNQKLRAIKSFRRGLKYDESNRAILDEVFKLGVRKSPILPFLPRRNVVNRVFGTLRARLQPGG